MPQVLGRFGAGEVGGHGKRRPRNPGVSSWLRWIGMRTQVLWGEGLRRLGNPVGTLDDITFREVKPCVASYRGTQPQ